MPLDEQQACDQLEALAGGIEPSFRLMRIFQGAKMDARPEDPWYPTHAPDLFRKRAKNRGFSNKAIAFYLEHMT